MGIIKDIFSKNSTSSGSTVPPSVSEPAVSSESTAVTVPVEKESTVGATAPARSGKKLAKGTNGMDEQSSQVLKSPVVSEKSTLLAAQHKYLFVVDRHATRARVARAVRQVYGVTVRSVNLKSIPERRVRVGRRIVTHARGKHAIVTLTSKDTIDITVLPQKK